MFEKLVVSTARRRSRRTVKFFVCTSITYLSVVAFALVLSICLETPKLADSSDPGLRIVSTLPPPPPRKSGPTRVDPATPRPDFRSFRNFDDLVDHNTSPPRVDPSAGLPQIGKIDGFSGGNENGLPGGTGDAAGVIGGNGKANDAPPKPPDPPKPAPRSVEPDTRPVRVSSTVLQGKVIERRVPIYPELAKRIRLQGDVAVEVIISPEGRVESVRAISGHPMLTQSALDSAHAWRFGPTFLNGIPVRVTGVITFVFKLND